MMSMIPSVKNIPAETNIDILLDQGFIWSEAIVIAVGNKVFDRLSEAEIKCASGFNGGIGSTHLGHCGALTGGIVLIGAVTGRSSPDQDNQKCKLLAKEYYERFSSLYGCTQCDEIKQKIREIDGCDSCRILLRNAAGILTIVIENA